METFSLPCVGHLLISWDENWEVRYRVELPIPPQFYLGDVAVSVDSVLFARVFPCFVATLYEIALTRYLVESIIAHSYHFETFTVSVVNMC